MTEAQNIDLNGYANALADRALTASRTMAVTSGAMRTAAMLAIADAIEKESQAIQAANAKDLTAGQTDGLSPAMLDRLKLDGQGIAKIVQSVRQIAQQPDPVGQVIEGSVRPNGLSLKKVRVPIGVVLIIFESRPNVTSDAAALCIKSGNACILRGGKEAIQSNLALAKAIAQGLAAAGLPADAVQVVQTPDRQLVNRLLKLNEKIDLVIPRGGESLIRAVVEESRIPVIKHYNGNCHVYFHADAAKDMAVAIGVNAKTQRTGVCNAAETFLFHRSTIASGVMQAVLDALLEKKVEIRGCSETCKLLTQAKPATEADWSTEYLDLILAVKVVDDIHQAIDHIHHYGSKHTDAIVTQNLAAAETFVQSVDTANVMVNASTRFSDGGEYGLGAEIGISTDKLHARGPMGAADLTAYKWVVTGQGHIRS